MAIGDFNGDGKPDLAVANYGVGTVSILLGTGTGSFGAKTDFATGFSPLSVAIGDFNADGKRDLAVANFNAGTVSILLQASASASSVGGVATDPELPGFTRTRVATEGGTSNRLMYGALAGALALAVLAAAGWWHLRARKAG